MLLHNANSSNSYHKPRGSYHYCLIGILISKPVFAQVFLGIISSEPASSYVFVGDSPTQDNGYPMVIISNDNVPLTSN